MFQVLGLFQVFYLKTETRKAGSVTPKHCH